MLVPWKEIQITGNNRGWLAETGSYLTAHSSKEPEFNDQVEAWRKSRLISLSLRLVSDQSLIGSGVARVASGCSRITSLFRRRKQRVGIS
jgi:hypothetical protein